MGCNLKDIAPVNTTNLDALAGKRVGIDAYLTAFQFLTAMRNTSKEGDGLPLRDENGNPVSHLMGFLHRTATLIGKGIIPVYIFDGESPELKAEEMAVRHARRIEAEAVHQEAMAAGDFELAQKMAQRSLHYTPLMVEETKRLLDLMGVPWVAAAAEGEAQAAIMAANGQLDVVATQDWDALLYGSPVLVRNLMDDGTKRYKRVVSAESISLSELLQVNGLTREQLVDLAIMIGTDYHPGVKGIGPKTGLKLIKEYGNLEAVCQAKEKEIPARLAEIRDIFLNHPSVEVDSASLKLRRYDREGLEQFLVRERQFKPTRLKNALDLMTQTTLFSFGL
jgi:flap endonuclease-1